MGKKFNNKKKLEMILSITNQLKKQHKVADYMPT